MGLLQFESDNEAVGIIKEEVEEDPFNDNGKDVQFLEDLERIEKVIEDDQEGVEEAVEDGVKEEVKEGVGEEVEAGVEEEVEEVVEEDVEEGVEEVEEEGAVNEDGVEEGVEEGFEEEYEEYAKEGNDLEATEDTLEEFGEPSADTIGNLLEPILPGMGQEHADNKDKYGDETATGEHHQVDVFNGKDKLVNHSLVYYNPTLTNSNVNLYGDKADTIVPVASAFRKGAKLTKHTCPPAKARQKGTCLQ